MVAADCRRHDSTHYSPPIPLLQQGPSMEDFGPSLRREGNLVDYKIMLDINLDFIQGQDDEDHCEKLNAEDSHDDASISNTDSEEGVRKEDGDDTEDGVYKEDGDDTDDGDGDAMEMVSRKKLKNMKLNAFLRLGDNCSKEKWRRSFEGCS